MINFIKAYLSIPSQCIYLIHWILPCTWYCWFIKILCTNFMHYFICRPNKIFEEFISWSATSLWLHQFIIFSNPLNRQVICCEIVASSINFLDPVHLLSVLISGISQDLSDWQMPKFYRFEKETSVQRFSYLHLVWEIWGLNPDSIAYIFSDLNSFW